MEKKFRSCRARSPPARTGSRGSPGRKNYTVDMPLPRMLYGRTVCSPYAHARIKTIDTSAAEAMGAVVINL